MLPPRSVGSYELGRQIPFTTGVSTTHANKQDVVWSPCSKFFSLYHLEESNFLIDSQASRLFLPIYFFKKVTVSEIQECIFALIWPCSQEYLFHSKISGTIFFQNHKYTK